MTTKLQSVAPLIAGVLCAGLNLSGARAAGGYPADIGYDRLRDVLGASTPTGSNVPVAQAEGVHPEPTDPDFTGKQLELLGVCVPPDELPDLCLNRGHPNAVGRLFYGNAGSIAPGINDIRAYIVDAWAQQALLNAGTAPPLLPGTVSARVFNHSWIGHSDVPDDRRLFDDLLRRLDWVIHRDEAVHVVGMDNYDGSGTPPPASLLLASSFNAITVGRTDGGHPRQTSALEASPYTAGRSRPHLVAPGDFTSNTTPKVAAAAALLVDIGHRIPFFSSGAPTPNRAGQLIYNAERAEVVKAVLMAGAALTTQNVWNPNPQKYPAPPQITDYGAAGFTANGLDARYGAGQLNIYNSMGILFSGERNSVADAGTMPANIPARGYDYDPAFGGLNNSNRIAGYRFYTGTRRWSLTATLAWNLDVRGDAGSDPTRFDGTATLYDLNLALFEQIVGTLQPPFRLRAASTSTHDNTETVSFTLEPNRAYVLYIAPGPAQALFLWDYALAWRIEPLP